jgi:hypothetical protein
VATTPPTERLYGREALVNEIRRKAGVVVIEGDSGVGKSAIVSALGRGWEPTDAVPGARLLTASRGAVQLALIDELSEVLWDHAASDSHLASRAWEVITQLVDKATTATAKGVSIALVESLHSAIGRRLGAEAEAASREVGKASTESTSDLEMELAAIAVIDVATQMIGLASRVAEAVGRRLVLRFDQTEVVHDDDLRLLEDLAERSIPELVILTGFSTADSIDSGPKLIRLERRGATRVVVPPLDDLGLTAWLRAERTPARQWSEVRRVSSGYPLFVRDALSLLAAGKSLSDIDVPSGFTSLMRRAWTSLPFDLRSKAMLLTGLVDLPDNDFLLLLLGIDQLEWSSLREELILRNIFVIRADSSTWFHDRRRAYLWSELASTNDRGVVASRTLTALREWQPNQRWIEPWVIGSLPDLLIDGLDKHDKGDEYLRKIRDLSRSELAIALAIIELVEPDGPLGQFANTSEVITYAVDRIGDVDDPSSALRALAELNVAHVATNEQSSIVCCIFEDALGYPALIAQIERALDVSVRPRFASTTFRSLLVPLMGPFISAVTAVGFGTINHHQAHFDELRLSETRASKHHRDLFGLGVVAKIENQHVSSTILFATAADREAAYRGFKSYGRGDGVSRPRFVAVDRVPQANYPEKRLEEILASLKLDESTQSIASPAELEEWVSGKILATDAIRRVSTKKERSLLGLRRARSIVLGIFPDLSSIEIEVDGCDDAELRTVEVDAGVTFSDPLLAVRLLEAGQLKRGERIGTVTHSFSRGSREVSSPIVAAIERLSQKSRGSSRWELARATSLDEIERIISTERRAQTAVADALRDQFNLPVPTRDLSRASIYVVLSRWLPDERWIGYTANALTVADGLGRVRITVGARPETRWPVDEVFARNAGLEDTTLVVSETDGIAEHILGRFAGRDRLRVDLDTPAPA